MGGVLITVPIGCTHIGHGKTVLFELVFWEKTFHFIRPPKWDKRRNK
jgi:hypothetical protein